MASNHVFEVGVAGAALTELFVQDLEGIRHSVILTSKRPETGQDGVVDAFD